MDKMTVKDSAETRANLYNTAIDAFEASGLTTEPFKGGVLVDLGNGYFAKMAISVCDATKFDLEEVRVENMPHRLKLVMPPQRKQQLRLLKRLRRMPKRLKKPLLNQQNNPLGL